MLRYLQAIAFEINLGCNLAKTHAGACPISDPKRWDKLDTSKPITDELIIDCCHNAYRNLGFRGWVMWHYFNEPLLAFDRIEALIPLLKEAVPCLRTEVHTNGEALPDDLSRLKCFDRVWITNYTGKDHSAIRNIHPCVTENGAPVLDARMSSPPSASTRRCRRMFDEFVIDYYGNGHICTGDWRGEVPIGNVWVDGYERVAAEFVAVRSQISLEPMSSGAPTFCKNCGLSMRDGDCIIDNELFREIAEYRAY